jgi:hypothetical protein
LARKKLRPGTPKPLKSDSKPEWNTYEVVAVKIPAKPGPAKAGS